MNNRERTNAVLHYRNYDRMPVVAFGYWDETVDKWAAEGHISKEDAEGYKRSGDASPADYNIMKQLGFDFNWRTIAGGETTLYPAFEEEVLELKSDGSKVIRNALGLIERVKPGVISIPEGVGTTLTGREAWEELYLPKLKCVDGRFDDAKLKKLAAESADRQDPLGVYMGGLYGSIRDMLGVEELCYLAVDDEELYAEIIDTVANLIYQVTEQSLSYGIEFDFGHFWEDICFRNGPLVHPQVFDELVGKHYRRLTDLCKQHGIDIVSLDCDGCIDLLIPTWIHNGVNTMFPIEVGTWNASIAPWRAQYGKTLRGVGGMDKRVFAQDKAAVDREIERLKPLVELGGYIPCPDHRIPPDAIFENVAYYCERFRHVFG